MQVPYSDQFVRLSIRPSLPPRSLIWIIAYLPLAQSGSYFIHRVPLGKGIAVPLNHIYSYKVKVIAQLCIKSGAYILSLCFNLANTSLTEWLWSNNVHILWMNFVGKGSRSYWITQKSFFSEHLYFPPSSIWLRLHINSVF